MKLGLLADIHEQTRQLQKALVVLQRHGAERFVVLGDVFDTGKRNEGPLWSGAWPSILSGRGST